jgi:PPOX class probable F420-dependent enzyme
MQAEEARARLAAARVARLATADAAGRPHLVPICLAVEGDVIYTAVDDVKPKRSSRLRRLANVRANPAVAVLADHYDDADWSRLWWARADGTARVLEAAEPEAAAALDLLAGRYRQFGARRHPGPVIAIRVDRWRGWLAVRPGT